VPEDKVISRYEKSMRLMFPVLEEAHDAAVYDNSGIVPQIIFTKDKVEVYACFSEHRQQPWIQKYLLSPAKEAGVEIRLC